ncbi:MAG: hypothetical protein Q8Q60_01815 [Candidatus Chromulinivorax sp.]|nr:hypothetical protein [Candidatus Chromulinivorax sp.]
MRKIFLLCFIALGTSISLYASCENVFEELKEDAYFFGSIEKGYMQDRIIELRELKLPSVPNQQLLIWIERIAEDELMIQPFMGRTNGSNRPFINGRYDRNEYAQIIFQEIQDHVKSKFHASTLVRVINRLSVGRAGIIGFETRNDAFEVKRELQSNIADHDIFFDHSKNLFMRCKH